MRLVKNISIILVILSLSVGVQSCGEYRISEEHFTGIWKINRYHVSGVDVTGGFKNSHRDYSIFVKPGHIFSETWIENDEAKSIQGEWKITPEGKKIVLTDSRNGRRVFDLNYMYTLKHSTGKEEIILRKI